MAQAKTYTKKQFIEDVKKEARPLRKHATKEELGKLSVVLLNPFSGESCIYGLTTGGCFSKRAATLIHACCKRFFKSRVNGSSLENETTENNFAYRTAVNGKKIPGVQTSQQLFNHRNQFRNYHYSSIEAYIMFEWAKKDNLIAYLKGETNKLIL